MHYRPTVLELLIIQIAVWFGLWMINDYIAALLTIIIGAIVLASLLIALLSELIEPSRVPKRIFGWMVTACVAPMLAAGAYRLIQLI